MGYLLNSLSNLPVDESVTLYIFVIDGTWETEHTDALRRNFHQIAREIGNNAIIAQGLREDFDHEVCEKYFGKSLSQVFPYLPAVLVTDAHPERLTEQNMRLIIPIGHAEKTSGDLGIFFRELSEFAINRNPGFLRRFEQKTDWASHTNAVVDLKPNIFGIGINMNALIDRWRVRNG